MWDVIARKNNFVLVRNRNEPDFFAFGVGHNSLSPDWFPVNQCGTLEEVQEELERWKNEIDSSNFFMLQVENAFLECLHNLT